MRNGVGFLSWWLAVLLPVTAIAQTPRSELAQRVAATGLEGGWAGTLGNVDVCSILVEQWAVDGDRVRYQARLVSGSQQPDPVYYEIVAVDGNRITLSGDTVLIVEGDLGFARPILSLRLAQEGLGDIRTLAANTRSSTSQVF